MFPSRVRPTIRYVREDCREDLPHYDVNLCAYETGALIRVREICAHLSEVGERLRLVKERLVYRVVVGDRMRVVAWQEPQSSTCAAFCEPFLTWVCAEGWRSDGSRSDCYRYFEALHKRQTLLPTSEDAKRHSLELAARVINQATHDAPRGIELALSNAGREVSFLCAGISTRLFLRPDREGANELYVAVDRSLLRNIGAAVVQGRVLSCLLSAFEDHCEVCEEVSPTDYPGAALSVWEYSVRYGLLR